MESSAGAVVSSAATVPAPPSAPAALSLDDQASAVLASAVSILRKYKFEATADLAESKSRADTQTRSVVVVGEVKRGKSSLVNALIGERGASPVDVASSTSATVHFVPATDTLPAGAVELLIPGGVQRIDRGELADWITTSGRRVVDPGTDVLPTGAVVATATDLLGGAVVVDTPGSGGLDPAHAQLAARTAETACVLVVVCDATTPLTAPEMEFIQGASATVDSVVLAVTKTDKNLRRWQPIAAENRGLLQQHLRRQIPVIGVSSLRALAAADHPDPARRQAGEQASGIAELRAEIRTRLDLGAALPAVDGLRTALEGLRKINAKNAADIAIAQDSGAALPELTAERDRLQELKDHSGQWEQYLGRDLTLARQAALAVLDERLEEIRTRWTGTINKSGMAVLRRNPQHFTAQIEKDLQAAMSASVQAFLDGVRAIVMQLFDSEVVWAEIEQQVLASLDPRLTTGEVASKRHGLLDPSILTMGMIGTSMLGALIGVGAVAGVVWVGVNLGWKAMRSGKTNLLTWLRETLGTARSTTARMLEATLSMSRPEIVIRYREHVKTTMEQVQAQIADAKEAARLDAATREATVTRLSKNQRVITAKCQEIENVIAKLTAAVQVSATTEGAA
ncbi:dynamin family protein [Prescottella equi]|uniref:dynamin family protein n=1 Tax=Rhodococcus hoagii TaxID=43767 RepID=UPI0021B434DB|nr:dynamin family protein [Prescottella equi]